jgi:hypothetical protein
MLKTFTAALVATVLIAGTALAAQPAANSTNTPATAPAVATSQAAPSGANNQPANAAAKSASSMAPVTSGKHASKQVRHHTAHAVKPAGTQNVKSPT